MQVKYFDSGGYNMLNIIHEDVKMLGKEKNTTIGLRVSWVNIKHGLSFLLDIIDPPTHL